MGRRRFTLEICEDYAFEYDTRGEWAKNHQSGYQAARRNGWPAACTGRMRERPLAREAREKEAEAREKEAEARKSKSTPAEFIPDSVIRGW